MDLTPVADGPAGYPYPEKSARHRLGVSKDEMRALRHSHLTEGTHFARGKQAAVWLNAAAIELLCAKAAPVPVNGEKRAPAPDPLDPAPVKIPVEVKLLVVNHRLKHPHLILACPVGDDPDRPQKTVRVRVQRTGNFLRRMEIPAVLVAGYTDLYDLNCNCPRKPGKW